MKPEIKPKTMPETPASTEIRVSPDVMELQRAIWEVSPRGMIATEGLKLILLLLAKNQDYGTSAWESPVLCQQMTARDALLVRMSDKIKRLQHLLQGNAPRVSESIDDTLRDLAGYCLLELARSAST